jgi:hypothetical protein
MQPFLVRNTLLSNPAMEGIAALPFPGEVPSALADIVTRFQQMKSSAGEIHTELHLVKPILKLLGFAFESKPMFFEEQIKGPDYALFRSEEERLRSASLWGTRSYYDNLLGLLVVKRYGRNLEEGISGFYLDFENRIPLYQSMYLAKKSGAPWGILTNGKNWLLLKRPVAFEKTIVEIDLEETVFGGSDEGMRLFYHIFSSEGLTSTLPDFLERERTELIGFLKAERSSLARRLAPAVPRAEVYRVAVPLFRRLFPESSLAVTGSIANQAGSGLDGRWSSKPVPTKGFDQCDVLTYLLARGAGTGIPALEETILDTLEEDRTKERLLSVKLLDMTPGFGNLTIELVETIAYLSFLLPYREKHSFVAEWENESLLHKFILDRVLFGAEKSDFSLDVLQCAALLRFAAGAANYRLGNPLLGMSMAELYAFAGDVGQAAPFSKHPHEVISELRDMYRLYFSLSDRIKEDAAVKGEIAATLHVCRQRVKDVMDLLTASYFDSIVEEGKIAELLSHLDADEEIWEAAKGTGWFRAARDLAERKHFFHMEIEFPFLLNDKFDLIVVQPELTYLWEEKVPPGEAAKAYVKRAMTYLSETGRIILVGSDPEELVPELKKSKRYAVETKSDAVIVTRRPA